jgi:hypothetical protein
MENLATLFGWIDLFKSTCRDKGISICSPSAAIAIMRRVGVRLRVES